MSTQVAGVLIDPFERPLANTDIDIRAITNTFAVLPGNTIKVTTNSQGQYNFILEPGSYAISVIIDGRAVYQGAISVTSTTPPGTLPELLKQSEMESELPLNYAEYFRQVQETVKDDADRAQAAANSVGDELEQAQAAAAASQSSAQASEQSNQQSQLAYQKTKTISDKFVDLDDAVTQTQQNAQQTQSDAAKTAADRQASEDAAQRAEQAADSAETVNDRSIRVPQNETINALPAAATRANTVASFDGSGQSTVTPVASFAQVDSSGKIPMSLIPAAAITEVFPVSSQAAMLALAADPGDVAIRTDLSKSFILMSSPASTLTNWLELKNDVLMQLAMGSGASKIGLQPSGSGFVMRNVADRLLDRVSVKDYGAKGDGTTDDTAAIQKAITQNNGRIYFPAGNFIVSSQLNFNQADVMIRGESRASTSVTFTGTGTMFSGVFTNSIRFFEVSDIRILCNTLAQAKAFYFEWPEDFEHGLVQRGSVRNVSIRGVDEYEQGFNTCFHCHQGDNINFIDCEFKGAGGGTGDQSRTYNSRCAVGVTITGRYSPVEYRFIACYFGSFADGLKVGDTAEGIYVSNCIFICTTTCIRWETGTWSPNWPGTGGQSAAGRPLLSIHNCHLSYFQYGVYTNGVGSIHESEILTYHNSNSDVNGIAFAHGNAADVFISNIESWGFCSSVYTDGVVFYTFVQFSSVNNYKGVAAASNSFRYVIEARDNSKNNIFKNINRRANSGASFTTGVLINDLSGGLNHIGIRGGLFYSTANQSVSSGPVTTVNFGARDYDPDNIWPGYGGNMVVPDGAQRVRLSGAVLFDGANGVSAREVSFSKNGQAVYGLGQLSVTSVAGKGTYLNVQGAVISANPGDIFTMNVRHDDGVNRNLVAGLCWAQMEILN